MIGKLVESGTKVRSNKGESQNSAIDSSPVTASSKKPTGVQKASISSASPLLICIYNVTVVRDCCSSALPDKSTAPLYYFILNLAIPKKSKPLEETVNTYESESELNGLLLVRLFSGKPR